MFKTLKFKALKALVNTIGQTSTGLQLCTKYGFTSGKMLDYIYENKPSGKFFIGEFLDRMYIRHPGWEVIRTRKNNLVYSLKKAVNECLKTNKDIYIVDVASGPARYILETMDSFRGKSIFVTCRDLDERWLEEGNKKAKAMNLNTIEFKKVDALDPASFIFSKTPDIMVSSGFYDWITDDELVKKSMKIIYDALPKGGYFVFTNQSGHVNLEMVSEVFTDFNHDPLKMKIRAANLVNSWAKDIGFKIIETNSDQNGYYSVTLAQK